MLALKKNRENPGFFSLQINTLLLQVSSFSSILLLTAATNSGKE